VTHLMYNGVDFADGTKAMGSLAELRQQFELAMPRFAAEYADFERDPYLRPEDAIDQEALLKRYLIAESFNVARALTRLEQTVAWRKQWRVLEYREPRAARRLFEPATNPGAEMYFADFGLKDRQGQPCLVGRLRMCNPTRMNAFNHLRAGIFVVEQAALALRHPNQSASYILDLSYLDFDATYSASAPASARRKGRQEGEHDAGAATEEDLEPVQSEQNATALSEPADIAALYPGLTPGLSVLRAAMGIMNAHYPELVAKIYIWHADWSFYAVSKIFLLWVNDRTRKKFKFVGKGYTEWAESTLLDDFDEAALPPEFGGSGPPLEQDNFLRQAVDRYG